MRAVRAAGQTAVKGIACYFNRINIYKEEVVGKKWKPLFVAGLIYNADLNRKATLRVLVAKVGHHG